MFIQALAFINNSISADLARRQIEADGIQLKNVALIMARDVLIDWDKKCGEVIRYGAKPSLSLFGQWRFVAFFFRAAQLIKRLKQQGTLREVYLVNNDNLLTSPFFIWAERCPKQIPGITVIAEGIMNYQQIDVRDRAAWRWRIKPWLAAFLGLPYRTPRGHLSGAYEPSVKRVVSFIHHALHAPQDRICIQPFTPVAARVAPEQEICLIVHTGLWQWMDSDSYRELAEAFAAWVEAQRFKTILVKNHPHIPTGILADLLPPHQMLSDARGIEAMAADIPAATVIGTCCTALITLKLIRPDLRCVDFGSERYCDVAYHGDRGVIDLMRSVDIELINGLS